MSASARKAVVVRHEACVWSPRTAMLSLLALRSARPSRLSRMVRPTSSSTAPWSYVRPLAIVPGQGGGRVFDEPIMKDGQKAAPQKEMTALEIMSSFKGYLWPKDSLELKSRVVTAIGLLVGSKVIRYINYISCW